MHYDWQFPLTSTSHNALLLVAAVADVLPVVRRNTFCFFSYSSIVRNFSCSAWNKRITSPPLSISSTFSSCLMNKVIFQEAFELSTLTWKMKDSKNHCSFYASRMFIYNRESIFFFRSWHKYENPSWWSSESDKCALNCVN